MLGRKGTWLRVDEGHPLSGAQMSLGSVCHPRGQRAGNSGEDIGLAP